VKARYGVLLLGLILGVAFLVPARAAAFDRDASQIVVVKHEWHPDEVWEKIGKTKFIWQATVRNDSDIRKRVYVYYDLLDGNGVPIARNVTNQYIDSHQTVDVKADSYILSEDLPNVRSSRVTVKVGL
jgi:hypothetical protein